MRDLEKRAGYTVPLAKSLRVRLTVFVLAVQLVAGIAMMSGMAYVMQERNLSLVTVGLIILFFSAASVLANVFVINRFVIEPVKILAQEISDYCDDICNPSFYSHNTPAGLHHGSEIGLLENIIIEMESHIHNAMAQLREAEEFTRAVSDASPLAYILFNKDLKAIDCNRTAMRIFDCTDKKYLLELYWQRFSPEYQPDGENSLIKAGQLKDKLAGNSPFSYKWVNLTSGGERFSMTTTILPLSHKGEKYYVAFKHDMRNVDDMEFAARVFGLDAQELDRDPLTGIYNKRYLNEHLESVIKTLARAGGDLCVLMIDIDFFKEYNDEYGYNKGDECLKAIAESLVASLTRADDFVARFGGEEFVIVLPNANDEAAPKIAQRLLERINGLCIPHEQNAAKSCVTVSIGVAVGKVKYSHSADSFIRRADEMMYKSKLNGRNGYIVGNM